MKKLNKKGFTIIEMVIVIAIIGILAAVLIPTYGNVVANANESAAMQTARSVMTNWLASTTSSAGVPTSGPDAEGNMLYAAYFEYTSNNQTYQYRYTSGGVERTDTDISKYVNWDKTEAIKGVYIQDPANTPNFDANAYAVNIYRIPQQTKAETPVTYYFYYIEYPAGSSSVGGVEFKYAYDFGGATVFAATSSAQKVYTLGEGGAAATVQSIGDITTGWAKTVTE